MTRIMKAFCAALSACLLCLAAAGAEAEPAKYPTAGHSTGSDVRLRNNPGTEGTEVVGKAALDRSFKVVGETSVNGETWYEVERPGKGTAWISGKFFELEVFRHPLGRAIVTTRLGLGATPEGARALFGKPESEKDGTVYEFKQREMSWPGLTLRFVSDDDGESRPDSWFLYDADVTGTAADFMGIRVGDDASKVTDILGPADDGGDDSLHYSDDGEFVNTLHFTLKDGKVTYMSYHSSID